MATMGPRTIGMAAADVLRNRIQLALDEYNVSGVPMLKDLLCESTYKDTIEVSQNAKTFVRLHGDLERAPMEHTDKQTITLPVPKKFGLGGGITRDALRDGITEAEVMQEHRTAIQADKRLVNQLIMAALFIDGGFWDASVAPPLWANNVMATSHDHYLAYNNAGVPSLTAVARGKRHLTEHGPTGDLIMFANGETLEKIEVQAEWIAAVANKTPLLNRLQEAGFEPNFKTDGVIWVQNDYCPLDYSIMLNIMPDEKMLAWRYSKLPADALIPGIADDKLYLFPDPEDVEYYMSEQLRRWGCVKVQKRGLACPFYWASATWTNPTVAEWIANAA